MLGARADIAAISAAGRVRGVARQVDRNLDLMAQTIAGSFVPELLEFERRGGRHARQADRAEMAFSDFRQIARGYYIGDTVDYATRPRGS